jgi:hypothetical protein
MLFSNLGLIYDNDSVTLRINQDKGVVCGNSIGHGTITKPMSLVQRNMKVYQQKLLCNYFLFEILGNEKTRNSFKEIGTVITNNEINFIFNTQTKYQKIIQKVIYDTINKYANIYLTLSLKYNVCVKIKFVYKKFTSNEIEKFTYYYFDPPLTDKRYIFKYCAVNKYFYKLISNNALWFSEPQKFSDGFDSRYKIDIEPSEINILNFYFKKYLEENAVENKKLTKNEFSKMFKIPNKEDFASDLEKHHYENTFSKLGVACFSENYDKALMWENYADGYKGVCLIFDLTIFKSKSKYFQFIGRKVRYFKSLPKYFFDATGKMEIGTIIFSKLTKNKYENEIRELINFQFEEIKRSIKFNPQALKGILFGPNCPESDKNKIIGKLNQQKKYKDFELIETIIDLIDQKIKVKEHKLDLNEKINR